MIHPHRAAKHLHHRKDSDCNWMQWALIFFLFLLFCFCSSIDFWYIDLPLKTNCTQRNSVPCEGLYLPYKVFIFLTLFLVSLLVKFAVYLLLICKDSEYMWTKYLITSSVLFIYLFIVVVIIIIIIAVIVERISASLSEPGWIFIFESRHLYLCVDSITSCSDCCARLSWKLICLVD